MPRLLFLSLLLSLGLLAGLLYSNQQAPAQAAPSNFGLIFAKPPSSEEVNNALTKLGMTWWYSFGPTPANPSGYNKVLLIRTKAEPLSQATLQSMAASASPGAYWIIGNEPNVPEQDWVYCPTSCTLGEEIDLNVATYVSRYRYYAEAIRAIDPNAKLVAGNVLNWDFFCSGCAGGGALGHNFVEKFLQEYRTQYGAPPRVDVWGIHTYDIHWRETPMVNWRLGAEELPTFRLFLDNFRFPDGASSGQEGKPIWVTEFGIIWGYTGWAPAGDDQCSQRQNCIVPTGIYEQTEITGYLRSFVGWLQANAGDKKIERWFLYTAFSFPEPYSNVFGGIAAMAGPGATANLSLSGEVYRDLGGGAAPTPTPTLTPVPTGQPSTGGGGGGGGSGAPTATPTATATPTPTAVPTPAPSQTSASGTLGASGGQLDLLGGSSVDRGISFIMPENALGSSVSFRVAYANAPPTDVLPPSGAEFLDWSLDILPGTGDQGTSFSLQRAAGIRVNLAPEDLRGRSIQDVRGGYVVGGRLEPRPTRVVNAAELVIWIDVDHLTKFTLFAITNPGPAITEPADGVVLPTLSAQLSWTNPAGATQYQIQVIPFNNDGPGINLIRNAESSYLAKGPSFGDADPNYVLLPDLTYVWRVRTTAATRSSGELTEVDWSAWSLRAFRTPPKSSATISLSFPNPGSTVPTRTPPLTWSNSDREVFYYEVQVSRDPGFGPDAFLYWELRHGGVTSPLNTYIIPSQFPLEGGATYYWRVRPRIQGDGAPLSWTPASSFAVAP
ncbi:MAG: hypothetical protein HYY02_02755 [Chloroflexi bacterium]|nr:hypothetical protein [Chloroflexota bacterium]